MGTSKSTIVMAININAQRLRRMILGNGHHEPAPAPAWLSANQAAAAMPLTYPAVVPSHQGYQSLYMVTPPPVVEQDQYTEFLALAAVDLAKKGARLQGSLCSHEMVAGYKRKRDEQPAPVLCAAHAQHQQTIVVDSVLLNHASKMWKALAEQKQRHMRLVTSVAEDRAAKWIKAKEEEMKCIWVRNQALQDRLRVLQRDAQLWRDFARSKMAAANALRGDLQHALTQAAARGRGVHDATSCYSGNNRVAIRGDNVHDEVSKPEAVARVGTCKGCGQGDAVELLLPCRHLSVCTPCAATARACPACGCDKKGSICVNFS